MSIHTAPFKDPNYIYLNQIDIIMNGKFKTRCYKAKTAQVFEGMEIISRANKRVDELLGKNTKRLIH